MVQKGECRPIGNDKYMSLKKESIRIASQPTKIVQKIDRAVNNFKPINAHRSEVLYLGKNFVAVSKYMLYF